MECKIKFSEDSRDRIYHRCAARARARALDIFIILVD